MYIRIVEVMGEIDGKRVSQLVAIHGGLEIVLGAVFVQWSPIQGSGCAYVSRLLVAESYRRNGVGRRLMEHILTMATAAGHDSVALDVKRANQAAMNLYRSLGFFESFPANGEDAYMSVRLKKDG